MNGKLDTGPSVTIVNFDSTNPTPPALWTKNPGPPRAGICASLNCHGTDSLDWYGTDVSGYQQCYTCHSYPIRIRRQIAGQGGDFASNPSITAHHVTGGSDPSNIQCLICHDQITHTGGTVQLVNADTGSSIAYNPITPSSLEPFCLSCHDSDGATYTFVSGGTPTNPFNDGSALGQAPYRAGVDIKDNWNKTYGHKQQGLTCLGNGDPNTGCHANGHGSTDVGILAKKLTLPNLNGNLYSAADELDYELCFTCHASYPRVTKEAVFGMNSNGKYAQDLLNYWGVVSAYTVSNIQTKFRDRNTNGAPTRLYEDPTIWSAEHENLHMYHVQIGPGAWNYRDSIPSSIVCLSCHNVHGSNTQWGWVYDEILFSHLTGSGTDEYGMMGVPKSVLSNYPTSCAFNCHAIFEDNLGVITHSWFEPSDE